MADILTKAALPSADKTAADRTLLPVDLASRAAWFVSGMRGGEGERHVFGTLNSAETGEGFPA